MDRSLARKEGKGLPAVHVIDIPRGANPGDPLTNFNDGGGQSDFFGSEILARSDLFGSMKDAGIFLGCKKKRGIFLGCKKRTKGFFGGMLKKVVIFLGRQILKL